MEAGRQWAEWPGQNRPQEIERGGIAPLQVAYRIDSHAPPRPRRGQDAPAPFERGYCFIKS